MAINYALRALSTLTVVFTAGTVQAEVIPPEGSVSVTYTATQIPPPKPMPIGGGREFALVNQAMAASNDSGSPILHNMGGRCQVSRLVDTSMKSVEVHGFCTYVDKDGDQTFEQCDFLPGQPNKCKITGGTGKFDGLQGELVITFEVAKSNFDGISQSIGHKKGAYKFVKTN